MAEKPTVPVSGSPAAKKTRGAPHSDASSTSYSNYLFGRAGDSDKPVWSDSTKGRAAIRLISRGIVGAAFMTYVEYATRRHLNNYDPTTFKWAGSPLGQRLAYSIDRTLGSGIQKIVGVMGPAATAQHRAHNATRFRYKGYYHAQPGHEVGRSLGAEMVAITAGFSAGSLGDAASRNIIQLFDPNIQKTWMVNDKGEPAKPDEKKHFDFEKWVSATLRSSWRILTKNAGEDWAVALPYVYQMRWQRNQIAKWFPDAKLSLDNSWNGGSLIANQGGKIVGDMQMPGAIDLHARFVGYNWYTLMYRETYDAVGRQLRRWADNGFSFSFHLPKNPISAAITGTFDSIGYGARYIAKSFIKSNLYMNPAVIPFWVMRVSQSKGRASPVMENQFTAHDAIGKLAPVPPYNPNSTHYGLADNGEVYYQFPTTKGRFIQDRGLTLRGAADTIHFGGGRTADASMLNKPGDVYSAGLMRQLRQERPVRGWFSTVINPFGWASYQAGSGATRVAAALSKTPMTAHKEFAIRDMVDNSFAYTPYMIAKAETALRVDERPADGGLGAMDKAIYKFIDSTVRFDLKNAGSAVKEIFSNAKDIGREVRGGETDPTAPTRSAAPISRIDARSSQRITSHQSPQHSDVPAGDERSWAESVTGRPLGERFQPSQQTIH